jgi:hypothetical protein
MSEQEQHAAAPAEKEPRPEIVPGSIIAFPKHLVGSRIYIVSEVTRDSDDEEYCYFVELNDAPNLRAYGWVGGTKTSTVDVILGQESVDIAAKAVEYSSLINPPKDTEEAKHILDTYRPKLAEIDDQKAL